MSENKNKPKRQVAGREQICESCPYKDFYNVFKNNLAMTSALERAGELVKTLQSQLIEAQEKLEKYEQNPKPEG